MKWLWILRRLGLCRRTKPKVRLFPEPPNRRTAPLAGLKPDVVWLQQSTRPEAVVARRRVNGWYQDFPDPRGELAAKLRSVDNQTHTAALDELYVHSVLRGVATDVRYEEGGQGQAPDFRAYQDGRQILAVEVLSLFERPEWAKEARRNAQLTDRLNEILEPDRYFLDVDVAVQDSSRNLPLKTLTDRAQAFLAWLPDPQIVAAEYQNGTPLPFDEYVQGGIYVRFTARPMRPGAAASTDPDARIVGMGPATGGPVNSDVRLKNALSAKRKKAYVLDPTVPYALVVGNHDRDCNDLQLLLALYGRDWEALMGKRQPLWQRELKYRGFFGIGKGEQPYNTRFSAVAVFSGWAVLGDLSQMQWLVFNNPHARLPLPDRLLPTTHRFQPLNGARWGWRPHRADP
jgi:hypothetical protein